MMILAWQKANPHYVVMRLPKKKLVPSAYSSWTSPELGLPKYMDGPKMAVWAAECRDSAEMSTSPSSMTAKDTIRTGAERQDVVPQGECLPLKPRRQEL